MNVFRISNFEFNNCLGFRILYLGFVATAVFCAFSANAAVISRAPSNLGLVGYWSFNDATSTNTAYPNRAVDFSGNGNTGILTNGPTWANGRLGKALSFDGSNDEVKVFSIFQRPH